MMFINTVCSSLDKTIQILTKISIVGVWCCGTLLLAASFLLGIEITIRKLYGISMSGVDELSGFVLAMSISWGFSFTLLKRGHIRIDTVYIRLPLSARVALDLLSLSSFLAFMIFVLLRAAEVLHQSIISGSVGYTRLEVPLVIPQTIWVTGYVFFAIVACALILRSIFALMQKDTTTVQELIGSTIASPEDEHYE